MSQLLGGAGGGGWGWGGSPISVQSLAGLRPANVIQLQGLPIAGLQGVQVQGGQAQQIITANAQTLQQLGLAGANVIGQQQQMAPLSPMQAGAQIISEFLVC